MALYGGPGPVKIYLVVAGSHAQFTRYVKDYCIVNRLSPEQRKHFRYVSSGMDLHGHDPMNTEFLFCGTFWQNPLCEEARDINRAWGNEG